VTEDVGTAEGHVQEPPPARLTVVEHVYYQATGEDAWEVPNSSYSRFLTTDEQPYVRKLTATEEWTKIDTGWLTECSTLVIVNEEGGFRSRLPTEEQKEETAKKILEVGFHQHNYDVGWLVVLPQESLRMCPSHLGKLFIRCQFGTAKFTIYIIPV